MKVVVFYGIGDICIDMVFDLEVFVVIDVVVCLIVSVICGIDLYMVCGMLGGMKLGMIFGYEGVGIVEVVGCDVCNLWCGDCVLILLMIVCGSCVYCCVGYIV